LELEKPANGNSRQ
jgi:hypothetical protein